MRTLFGVLLLGFLLMACNRHYEYRIILTSGINEQGLPIDVREDFRITEEKIYIFMRWVNLKDKDNEFEVKIYDGKGNLVTTRRQEFTAETGSSNTWMWYKLNKALDYPGAWKYIVYLNGYKIKEQNFKVLF
jgi:hypothetical protein